MSIAPSCNTSHYYIIAVDLFTVVCELRKDRYDIDLYQVLGGRMYKSAGHTLLLKMLIDRFGVYLGLVELQSFVPIPHSSEALTLSISIMETNLFAI